MDLRHRQGLAYLMVNLAWALTACSGGADGASPPVVAEPASQVAPPPAPPANPTPLPPAVFSETPVQSVNACAAGFAAEDILPALAPAADCDSARYVTVEDLAYGAHESAKLDLLVPSESAGPVPVVMWVHGGGWRSGDKADRSQARRLVCRGYAVAAINYRLSGVAIFPAQIHDVKAALRFLRANASNYGLDASRIAVFGSSAGGHLAALAGTSDGADGLEDTAAGNAPVSSRAQAIVDWYGPTRLTEMDAQLAMQGCPAGSARHNDAGSAESELLGCTLGDAACASSAARADPTSYSDRSDPPHLIMHGTEDCVSPEGQSALLADSLNAVGACAVKRRVVGAAHGGPEWVSAPAQDAAAEFLDRVFAREAVAPAIVNCAAFTVAGDPTATAGARWTYRSVDAGLEFRLSGVLFKPAANGPFPAVVVSHGYGGSAASYSSNVARIMRGWGMVAIATNYTHANAPAFEELPQGDLGASDANVARAHKARDLLSCLGDVDLHRVAAHGHSMGAFVTAQMLGTHPGDFAAASHTAGGATESGPNATRLVTAARIRTPYQLHHGDADTVVDVSLDRALSDVLTTSRTVHELYVHPGYSHDAIATDAAMLERVRDWYRAKGVL